MPISFVSAEELREYVIHTLKSQPEHAFTSYEELKEYTVNNFSDKELKEYYQSVEHDDNELQSYLQRRYQN